ncbi:MAG: hypothetical protein OEZ47_17175, partial [Gammaproteobacteria bacterium]|nr:hypothetical protein [Gammaproteobacteria bacterium]
TPQKPELDRDWSLVGNWVSRQENKAISNGPSFREKVVFRGDGMMIILEGVVKSGENEVMVPGSKALQLKWRTEKKELWVSTEKADKWLKYGDYRTENDSLMLLRDLKKSKQIFLREVFK